MDELILSAGPGAFGDAAHPTTRLLLSAIEGIEGLTPARICDIGCGSGILSLRARQRWPDAEVLACDLERSAVEAAAANAAANGLTITCLHADGFRHPAIAASAPYDLILMNILAEPILRLLADAHRHLAPEGLLMLSGLLTWQQQPILEAAEGLGMERAYRLTQGDWVALLLRRP